MTRDPRDRGDVKLPSDFGVLVAGYVLLCGAVPICVGASASVWLTAGGNAFVAGLFGAMAFGMAMILPVALGVGRRRFWWIRWVRSASAALFVLYVLAWLVVLAHPLGLVPSRAGIRPGFGAGDFLAVAMMALIGLPAAAMLGYALRRPYWHPAAPRDQWTV